MNKATIMAMKRMSLINDYLSRTIDIDLITIVSINRLIHNSSFLLIKKVFIWIG